MPISRDKLTAIEFWLRGMGGWISDRNLATFCLTRLKLDPSQIKGSELKIAATDILRSIEGILKTAYFLLIHAKPTTAANPVRIFVRALALSPHCHS
jgi:hypothetical protein